MIIRMFEYDVQLALENKEMTADTLTVRFPDSAIVSLWHSKNTPEVMTVKVQTPGGSTEGNPVVYAEKTVDPGAKTVLVYGHYDVMPVDPRDEWRTEPFEPVIRDGRIWGRGADDDKGQLWMHAKAFEAMCATDSLPCNVKFMLEGEEEIGSPSLYGFCEQNKELLKADIILVSDTSMISMQTPSITCGLRGLAYMEVEVTGPDKDLHSGLFGGAVANPANVLARLVAGLVDENG